MNKNKNLQIIILCILTVLSLGIYIASSKYYYRLGFPLDDAWIHQTYARNLASGEWAFIPGEISGGSTSPLWTFIVSIGYMLKMDPLLWTFGVNFLILWGTAVIVEESIRTYSSSYDPQFPWMGALLIFEWHLVWSAGSGMETLLFSALVVVFFVALLKNVLNLWLLGLVIGLSTWVRPEGITLLGPALVVIVYKWRTFKYKLKDLLKLFIPLGVFIGFYLVFFYQVSGNPLPTTFYAKQVEYQSLTSIPYLKRMGTLGLQLFIGPGIILLPGFLFNLRKKKHILVVISASLWILGMISLYALILPVTYQHGRYMVPCTVILLLFGCFGMVRYLKNTKTKFSIPGITWKFSLAIILFYFWFSGALAYGKDVSLIEKQMVDTAFWVNQNIPSDKIVAAHDIGALGYFDEHELIDLAGLITPEIISIINHEDLMSSYLDESNASYVISFPNWYANLTSGLQIVHSGIMNDNQSDEVMNVYEWETRGGN
ncbi:hypothetical protein ACFLTX_01180 [Chloroflexota bacterium]